MFNFSIVIVLSLPLDHICSQVHILTSSMVLWCPVTEKGSI